MRLAERCSCGRAIAKTALSSDKILGKKDQRCQKEKLRGKNEKGTKRNGAVFLGRLAKSIQLEANDYGRNRKKQSNELGFKKKKKKIQKVLTANGTPGLGWVGEKKKMGETSLRPGHRGDSKGGGEKLRNRIFRRNKGREEGKKRAIVGSQFNGRAHKKRKV